MMSNKHIGSDFDNFLREEGELKAATDIAHHRIAEWRDVRPESVETFRKIHASKEFTAKAAHAAFVGASAGKDGREI